MSDSNFLKVSFQNNEETTIVNPTSIPINSESPTSKFTTDPWQRYYAPLIAEFMSSLLYTLFCKKNFFKDNN